MDSERKFKWKNDYYPRLKEIQWFRRWRLHISTKRPLPTANRWRKWTPKHDGVGVDHKQLLGTPGTVILFTDLQGLHWLYSTPSCFGRSFLPSVSWLRTFGWYIKYFLVASAWINEFLFFFTSLSLISSPLWIHLLYFSFIWSMIGPSWHENLCEEMPNFELKLNLFNYDRKDLAADLIIKYSAFNQLKQGSG